MHSPQRYTLYPPGHYPYGRQPLAPVSASGQLLVDADARQVRFEGTVFQASLDAAEGIRWREDSPADDPRRRRTQGRHLELAERLVGVQAALSGRLEEQVAARLGVAVMTVRQAAATASRSWTRRAAAVLAVLGVLTLDGSLLDRFLSAGLAAGLWPRPRRWCRRRGWLAARALPSPPQPATARGPPTNSQGATLDGFEAGSGL